MEVNFIDLRKGGFGLVKRWVVVFKKFTSPQNTKMKLFPLPHLPFAFDYNIDAIAISDAKLG